MPSAAMLLPLGCLLTTFLGCVTAFNSPVEPASPDPRLLFKFITITPEQCNSDSGDSGICYSKSDCNNLNGTSDGNCAKGLGVCCTFTRTCDQSTRYSETTFANPSYPNAESDSTGNCELTIIPMNDNICQLRLDFDEFTLAQPDVAGQCVDDFMLVSGGASSIPVICGDNGGQHMYVDIIPNSTGNIKINMDSSTSGAKWNIKVTQIPCTSLDKAPGGCLQYFTETSGVVSSFNYVSTTTAPTTTRQLADQEYGVCIQSRSGYCSITWEQPDGEGEYYFSMSGDAGSGVPNATGVSLVGNDCTTDYVIIPDGEYPDTAVTGNTLRADRFCGFGFPSDVISGVTPYVLYVITDSDEVNAATDPVPTDFANQGFSLRYRANACK